MNLFPFKDPSFKIQHSEKLQASKPRHFHIVMIVTRVFDANPNTENTAPLKERAF